MFSNSMSDAMRIIYYIYVAKLYANVLTCKGNPAYFANKMHIMGAMAKRHKQCPTVYVH